MDRPRERGYPLTLSCVNTRRRTCETFSAKRRRYGLKAADTVAEHVERVLVVASDADACRSLVYTLSDTFKVDIARNGPDAIRRLTSHLPHAIVTDVDLPVVSGLDVVAIAHGMDPTLPVLIMTDANGVEQAFEAMRLGAYDYLMKPLRNLDDVRLHLDRALKAANLQRENARLVDDLRSAGEFKRRLMRTVSHDYKNLLTVILGYARLAAKSGAQNPELLAECLDRIVNTSRLMATMAEDLGTYSQMDGNCLKLDRKCVSLMDCIQGAVQATLIDPTLIRLRLPQENVNTHADRQRTTQILANLLGNAVKYSPMGGEVTISHVSRDGWVEVSVEDQGLGIPTQHLEALFRPFFRLERDLQSGIPGSGLGLTIVQSLVEAQGGRIWATSQEGAGSRFTFTVPANPPHVRSAP